MAPIWATLLLCMCEYDVVLPAGVSLSRFIDDGILLHYVDEVHFICDKLNKVYPINLNLTFEVKNQPRSIPFMDVLIISLKPHQISFTGKNHLPVAALPGVATHRGMCARDGPVGSASHTYACVVKGNSTGCALRRYRELCDAWDALFNMVQTMPLPWESKHKYT